MGINCTTKYKSNANEAAIISGDKYRITVLTDRLIRLEYSDAGIFNDNVTQNVVNRFFDLPEYEVIQGEVNLEIITNDLHIFYDRKSFTSEGLEIHLKGDYAVHGAKWNYGDELHDLMGTARTLDNTNGSIELEHGLMSRDGFSVLDDSNTAIIGDDKWLIPRVGDNKDIYFFGYGHDYMGCLRDFYKLCGNVPLIPKYALGNWWSRFFKYTESTYLELMNQFEAEDIPLAVSVIDMDWHLTCIPKEYGSGWTGFTWNRKLFPDPEGFMDKLHNKGLHVTLNVHPADGVRAHEEQYPAMARALGIDPDTKRKLPFDVADKSFMDCYFKYLHHPNEDMGVDFWWIDWQQRNGSSLKGIDTLWALNYYYFMDNSRNGKRPMTFSRYAGIGSHRYPIGFSGDTINSWESLDFQPYFTANATNVGYSYWSHDIGGHMQGTHDEERSVRWLQFGVFSPIMRLHSSANLFYYKEPWNFNSQNRKIMGDFLRLRHKMIPYMYTLAYRLTKYGEPLIAPMYYRNDVEEAYHSPNEYYLGEKMLICPITEKADKETLLARFDTYLPEGKWYDLFNHRVYEGGRRIMMYRNIESIPVLVKEGAILPFTSDYKHSHNSNPKELEIHVYNGANGEFELYEDSSAYTDSDVAETAYTRIETSIKKDRIIIDISVDDEDHILPEDRTYKFIVHGIDDVHSVLDAGEEICFDYNNAHELVFSIAGENLLRTTIDVVPETLDIMKPSYSDEIFKILKRAEIEYDIKQRIIEVINRENNINRMIGCLYELGISDSLLGAIIEILTA